MQAENVMNFYWPDINNTVAIVAIVLALAIFIFGAFSGARANKVRIVFAVCTATSIGWCAMPLVVKLASTLNLMGTNLSAMVLITIMMFIVAAVATCLYEVITVTFTDVGFSPKK